MVFYNKKVTCFVENKVDSKEGYKQLERYASVLSNIIEGNPTQKVYLRYCTKNSDLKEIEK